MNKEELLKIYSAYLPYELLFSRKGKTHTLTCIRTESNSNNNLMLGDNDFMYYSYDCKPILYPVTFETLIKEIEHKGKLFVPIIEILKKQSRFDLNECDFEISPDEEDGVFYIYVDACNKKGRYVDSISYDGNVFYNHENHQDKPVNPQWDIQSLLLKWHFNVFQIPASQFINKATLNK